eukprot:m.114364 g.114364  ORF g.114364 m.114364 type:complete len:88 (+) comp37491_c0_seq3:208-471(+)
MILAIAVNLVLQFIIGLFLPVVLDGEQQTNSSLVHAGSAFFLIAILFPILSLVPSVIQLAAEAWSDEENAPESSHDVLSAGRFSLYY